MHHLSAFTFTSTSLRFPPLRHGVCLRRAARTARWRPVFFLIDYGLSFYLEYRGFNSNLWLLLIPPSPSFSLLCLGMICVCCWNMRFMRVGMNECCGIDGSMDGCAKEGGGGGCRRNKPCSFWWWIVVF